MSISKNFYSFSGKENLMASFNNWLMENIGGGQLYGDKLLNGNEFFWSFDYPVAPQRFPAISTTELGLFNLGETALGKFLGYDSNGNEIFGNKNQTLVEITCISKDTETFKGSTRVVRNLRDRVVQAFQSSIIPLRDYNKQDAPEVGTIEIDPESNSINEKFLVDPESQNIKRYVLIVRIFWIEVNNRSVVQKINSDAEIS